MHEPAVVIAAFLGIVVISLSPLVALDGGKKVARWMQVVGGIHILPGIFLLWTRIIFGG